MPIDKLDKAKEVLKDLANRCQSGIDGFNAEVKYNEMPREEADGEIAIQSKFKDALQTALEVIEDRLAGRLKTFKEWTMLEEGDDCVMFCSEVVEHKQQSEKYREALELLRYTLKDWKEKIDNTDKVLLDIIQSALKDK